MENESALHAAGPLVWTQPKAMSRAYELRSGEAVVGHLRFEKASGSLASAEVSSQRWTFKRVGFLTPRVTVRTVGLDTNLAVFHPRWSSGGTLHFADGHQAQWRCTNFWGSQWAFVGNDGEMVVQFRHHGGFLKVSAELEIASYRAGSPEVSLLVALGWYLMILAADDAAAVIVNSTVVS